MKENNERPICHRAEDLVTYLYNEANEAEARDFASHAEACDACRTELAAYTQVHESILLWRDDALGAAFSTAVLPAPATTEARTNSIQAVQPENGLSTLSALRRVLSVSPLWLRAATAFAALVFCVLAVLAISRSWNKPGPQAYSPPKSDAYSKEQFEAAVAQEVKVRMDQLARKNSSASTSAATTDGSNDESRLQLAGNRTQPKVRPRGLTRQEREQLAADLRLIPRDDDELPFVFSEEPNQ
jgi:anti-sigma factor RsiW